MTCREAIEVMAEFLDQTLSSDGLTALEEHLRDCAPCRAYLATYRKTRGLVGQAGQVDMPVEMRERLRRFLLDQLNRPPC
jgi:anti-sigma factor RsiW